MVHEYIWLINNLNENNDSPVINHYSGVLRQTHVSQIRSACATAFFCFGSFSCEPWPQYDRHATAVTGWAALWNERRWFVKEVTRTWLAPKNCSCSHMLTWVWICWIWKHWENRVGHHFPDRNDPKMVGKPLAASPSIHVVVAPRRDIQGKPWKLDGLAHAQMPMTPQICESICEIWIILGEWSGFTMILAANHGQWLMGPVHTWPFGSCRKQIASHQAWSLRKWHELMAPGPCLPIGWAHVLPAIHQKVSRRAGGPTWCRSDASTVAFLLCPCQKSLVVQVADLDPHGRRSNKGHAPEARRGVLSEGRSCELDFHKPNPNNWDKHCSENGGIKTVQ